MKLPLLATVAVSALLVACNEDSTQVTEDNQPITQESLQGIWHFVESTLSGEVNGELGEGILQIQETEGTWIFRDKYTQSATFTLNSDVNPTQIIWDFPEQNGEAAAIIHEIVKLEGDTITFSATDDDALAPTAFGMPDEGHTTTVYQKVNP